MSSKVDANWAAGRASNDSAGRHNALKWDNDTLKLTCCYGAGAEHAEFAHKTHFAIPTDTPHRHLVQAQTADLQHHLEEQLPDREPGMATAINQATHFPKH